MKYILEGLRDIYIYIYILEGLREIYKNIFWRGYLKKNIYIYIC